MRSRRTNARAVLALLVSLSLAVVGPGLSRATAQDITPLLLPDGYPAAVSLGDVQYTFDRPTAFAPDDLTSAGTDGDLTLLTRDRTDAAYATSGTGPVVRYVPSHADDPSVTCLAEQPNRGSLSTQDLTYAYAGPEPDLGPGDLNPVPGASITIDGSSAPLFVLPDAGATPTEIWVNTGGLERFVATDAAGLPPQIAGPVTVGDLDLTNPTEVTGSVDLQTLTRLGCAGPFATLVDPSEPSLAFIVVGDRIFSFDATPTSSVGATPAASTTVATEEPTATTPVEPTATATATEEPTATATLEPTATATATEEPTATATATSTPEPTATATEQPTATPTPEPTATATPEPTATATVEPTATATPEPTATATVPPEPTATATQAATVLATQTPVPDVTAAAVAPTATTAPAGPPAATEAPTATAAPTEAAAPTQVAAPTGAPTSPATSAASAPTTAAPTAAAPAPTATRVLQPPAIVLTVPADVAPAVATVAPSACSGPIGPYAADGYPELLPRQIQLSGVAYRSAGFADPAASGALSRIGCVGGFEAVSSDQFDAASTLFLRVPEASLVAGQESLFRYDVALTFTVRVESAQQPALISNGANSFSAGPSWVRSVYSSVTVELYVPTADNLAPDLLYGVRVGGGIIGSYARVTSTDTVANQDLVATAEAGGLSGELAIADQRYVLTAIWTPVGTTTNGFVTLYSDAAQPDGTTLLGLDPRDEGLLIFNRPA